jgi:hypothetical protein
VEVDVDQLLVQWKSVGEADEQVRFLDEYMKCVSEAIGEEDRRRFRDALTAQGEARVGFERALVASGLTEERWKALLARRLEEQQVVAEIARRELTTGRDVAGPSFAAGDDSDVIIISSSAPSPMSVEGGAPEVEGAATVPGGSEPVEGVVPAVVPGVHPLLGVGEPVKEVVPAVVPEVPPLSGGADVQGDVVVPVVPEAPEGLGRQVQSPLAEAEAEGEQRQVEVGLAEGEERQVEVPLASGGGHGFGEGGGDGTAVGGGDETAAVGAEGSGGQGPGSGSQRAGRVVSGLRKA